MMMSLLSFELPTVVDRRSPTYARWVQASLNQVSSAGLVVDGQIGPKTRGAIQAFQRSRGLVADGVVGPKTEAALVAAGAPAPPLGGGSVAPPPVPIPPGGAPPLIRTESFPPSMTLYVGIKLGGEQAARPMTGIFLPAGFRPTPEIDLVLYFHGHKYSAPALSIDGYWNRAKYSHYALREPTNDSRRNIVLAAPTLGPLSEAGWLTKPGGLDRYIDQILRALSAYGPYRGTGAKPVVKSVILSCHSGGGVPMRLLALSNDRSAALIRECWGFDCLYNKADKDWVPWAQSHPAIKLFVHYLGSTTPNSTMLQREATRLGLGNVSVTPSTATFHGGVPIAHWRQRLETASFLTNT
jgi:hypothetical protein